MKLLRYGPAGIEKPGLLDSKGVIRDLSAHVPDIDALALSPRELAALARLAPAKLPAVRGKPRLGPPVAGIGKLVCIGLNYSDHAREAGQPIPKEPIIFMKATTSVSGPDDPVVIPKGSTKCDWEVELGIVMGSRARYVAERDALRHVAGYCVFNDVSEREHQLEGTGQWVKGKSHDTFAPIGPWVVTRDEVPDPQKLDLWLEVNGKRRQNGNTRTMIFGAAFLVSYVSRYMTLEPGDVIATGTPPGVGLGFKPPVFLEAGDTMRVSVQGLGVQQQKVVAYRG
ncbi:MAG: fumarylacetoacetate hydrolase family protein [Gammaproteobacteria bacterium]|nr:fumarylacetoacetate hydrolase family protein [Gammaproteobacteria bacterium]